MKLFLFLLIQAAMSWAQVTETVPVVTQPPAVRFILELNLNQLQWADLALGEDSFKRPLISAWMKWLSENSTSMPVSICDQDCLVFRNKWQEISSGKLTEEMVRPFQQNLFLKITLYLARKSYVPTIQEHTFEWEGRVSLTDISTGKLISAIELPHTKKTWRLLDQKQLNSNLASFIYQSGLSGLKQIQQKNLLSPLKHRSSVIIVQGHRHLGDVTALIGQMKVRALTLGIDVQLNSFNKSEARLIVFHPPEEKSITDLLSQLKELKSFQSYKIAAEFNGVHHVLKLVTE